MSHVREVAGQHAADDRMAGPQLRRQRRLIHHALPAGEAPLPRRAVHEGPVRVVLLIDEPVLLTVLHQAVGRRRRVAGKSHDHHGHAGGTAAVGCDGPRAVGRAAPSLIPLQIVWDLAGRRGRLHGIRYGTVLVRHVILYEVQRLFILVDQGDDLFRASFLSCLLLHLRDPGLLLLLRRKLPVLLLCLLLLLFLLPRLPGGLLFLPGLRAVHGNAACDAADKDHGGRPQDQPLLLSCTYSVVPTMFQIYLPFVYCLFLVSAAGRVFLLLPGQARRPSKERKNSAGGNAKIPQIKRQAGPFLPPAPKRKIIHHFPPQDAVGQIAERAACEKGHPGLLKDPAPLLKEQGVPHREERAKQRRKPRHKAGRSVQQPEGRAAVVHLPEDDPPSQRRPVMPLRHIVLHILLDPDVRRCNGEHSRREKAVTSPL